PTPHSSPTRRSSDLGHGQKQVRRPRPPARLERPRRPLPPIRNRPRRPRGFLLPPAPPSLEPPPPQSNTFLHGSSTRFQQPRPPATRRQRLPRTRRRPRRRP